MKIVFILIFIEILHSYPVYHRQPTLWLYAIYVDVKWMVKISIRSYYIYDIAYVNLQSH